MHCQMKSRVIPLYSLYQLFHDDLCFQLLPNLTLQGLFW